MNANRRESEAIGCSRRIRVHWRPFAVAQKRFEQEATEGTEMDWILCCLGFLRWVWKSQRIRPNGWICFRVFTAWSVKRRPCSWTEPPDPDSKACLTAIKADGADRLDGFSKRSEFGRRLIRNVRRM